MPGYAQLLDGPPLMWRWALEAPLFLREARTARESFELAITAARERGIAGALPPLIYLLARDAATTDRWPEARARYHEAAELAHDTGQPGEECAALAGLAWLEAREGLEERCRAHAARGARARARVRARALRGLGAGGARRPRARARPARRGRRAPGRHERGARRALGIARRRSVARARARRGARAVRARRRGARRVAAPFASAPPRRDSRGRSPARRATRASSPPTTVRRLVRAGAALARARRRTRSSARARARLRRAPAPRAPAGRRARAPARRPRGASAQLGAEPWAERAGSSSRRRGETARKRDPSTLDQLTPRELQIALDLAAGLTTREAAAKLYLSPKTIEYHLRSVYRKLGIASRSELAEAFADPR